MSAPAEKRHSTLADALAPHMAKIAKIRSFAPVIPDEPKDVDIHDILLVRRELRSADVAGLGRVYYYHPQSVAERDAYHRHIRFDGESARISMAGMVDGIIARLRTKDGKPLFAASHRDRLFDMPASVLLDIWHAIGDEEAKPISKAAVEAAEKK